MCDGPGGGNGGADPSADARGTLEQRGWANAGAGSGKPPSLGDRAENLLKSDKFLPTMMLPLVGSAAMWALNAIPDKNKSPGGPLGDSKQGSTPGAAAGGDAPQRTVLTQAAEKKEDDTRRATRGKTVLTAANIRRPVLSKKEPLGSTGSLA